MPRRVPATLEVYEPQTDYILPPDGVVPFAEGLRRVEAGEATFCKHNRAIRMKSSSSKPSISEPSRPALGVADMEAAAGVRKMTTRRAARIKTWAAPSIKSVTIPANSDETGGRWCT